MHSTKYCTIAAISHQKLHRWCNDISPQTIERIGVRGLAQFMHSKKIYTAKMAVTNVKGKHMDLFERIATYLNKVGCADINEIANEMPCSVAVALHYMRRDAGMFWQSHDGMWFAVGKLADAVDTNP